MDHSVVVATRFVPDARTGARRKPISRSADELDYPGQAAQNGAVAGDQLYPGRHRFESRSEVSKHPGDCQLRCTDNIRQGRWNRMAGQALASGVHMARLPPCRLAGLRRTNTHPWPPDKISAPLDSSPNSSQSPPRNTPNRQRGRTPTSHTLACWRPNTLAGRSVISGVGSDWT